MQRIGYCWLAVAAILVGATHNVSAQDVKATSTDLKQIEKQIGTEKSAAAKARARAEIMGREIAKLQSDLVTTAKAVQRHEEQVTAVQSRLKALEKLTARKARDLRDGRAQFGRVLSAMQRIAQFPPEALIAQPQSPADTVRTAILLRATVGEIDRRAGELRGELDFLTKAKVEIAEREKSLKESSELLDRERRRLGAMMSRKKVLKRRADKSATVAERRVAALASKAKSLQDLLSGLAREKKSQQEKPQKTAASGASGVARSVPPVSKARGSMNLPAVGRVTGRYGEKTNEGFSRKGITVATPSNAQVVATYDGIAVYAGKFRGYGLLLIIDHGEGYHTLLAGMIRIDVEQGQQVLAGEPVGVMEQSEGAKPVLYVELRRDGQPINPIPWLAARKKDEVNG